MGHFIEDACGILSAGEIRTVDLASNAPRIEHDWLPTRRPVKVGVLAGASCPEVVVGEVLQRLAGFLA